MSALALYCLEREGAKFVLHTAMNPSVPWENITVWSKTRAELLERSGSRYAPSSPCAALQSIEQSDKPCVFIGKPCDAAAVDQLRKTRPQLDANLCLILTFFCAGPPCTRGTLHLLESLGIDQSDVKEIRYRGNGWPGNFRVIYGNEKHEQSLSYGESWSKLAKHHRSLRCHLCPDGLGELADISCGDAWHRDSKSGDPGRSVVLVRSLRGKEIVDRARRAGYLQVDPCDAKMVLSAQQLSRRRSETFGRLVGLRTFMIPVPQFVGFSLFRAWLAEASLYVKMRSVFGTIIRVIKRKLYLRKTYCS